MPVFGCKDNWNRSLFLIKVGGDVRKMKGNFQRIWNKNRNWSLVFSKMSNLNSYIYSRQINVRYMRRLKLYYLFFHSTLKINVPLSILGALIVSKADWGIVASLLYKEFLEKEAYFFYYNSGILKRNLIVFVFAVYWSVLWIVKLCITCLK